MKIIKIITIFSFILILLEGYAYYNILVSEKYEVDLKETDYKVRGISLPQAKIEAKKREILEQKKSTKVELTLFTGVFITLVSIWVYNEIKSKRNT
jgi:hypothetical protein